MNKDGPLVIIEDDIADQELFKFAYDRLDFPNEILFFSDGEEALEYFDETDIDPFIIISDIKLPKLDGYEIREILRTNPKYKNKCIPYIFYSTTKSWISTNEDDRFQGFFIKTANIEDWEFTLKNIMVYWKLSVAPGAV